MKKMHFRLLLVAITLAASSGWAVLETFDTDPVTRGWAGVNNTSSGNSFGFVPSNGSGNNVGSDSASGEAGGLLVRSTTEASYGATNVGTLSLSIPLAASGSFEFTAQHATGQGYLQVVGYYSASVTDPSFAGFLIAEAGGGSTGPRLFSWVRFSDGTQRLSAALDAGPIDLADETFAISYDPTANSGLGSLVASWTGVTASGTGSGSRTALLLAGDKSKAIQLNAFGLLATASNPFPGTDDISLFIDDVTYVPEPAVASLGGLGWVMLRYWRRQRR